MIEQLLDGFVNVFLLVIMLFGLFGMVIPIFPGGFVIWLATFFYGLVTGALHGAGLVIFIIITVLMIAGIVVDDVLMAAAARKNGALWRSLALAFVGGVIGTFLLPPFGGLLAAPLLMYISEYLRKRDRRQAWRVTRGLLIGWGWSFVARFGIGTVMIGLWFAWVWLNPA